MREDDQVKVAVAFKKDMVLSTGWKILCEDDEIREGIERNLKEGLGVPFEEVIREVLSSYEYGFSISEPVYQLINSMYAWKSIKTRPPHTFLFDIDEHGNILSISQSTQKNGQVKNNPEKLLHHVYQPNFGNPYGISDLKAAHGPWKGKKFIFRFMAMYLEKFACPLTVGKYKSSLSADQVNRLNEMLKTIQTATTLTIPEETVIDIIQTARDSTDAYIKAINLCNMMISRSILVPDLMGIGGAESGGGSYSLGQTQFKLFQSTVQKDRKALERLITMRLIKPLTQANWGDVECSFQFNEYTVEDEIEYSKLWLEAIKGNVYKPNEEEIEHFRSQMKYPQGPVEIVDRVQMEQDRFDAKNEMLKNKKPGNFSLHTHAARRKLTVYEMNKQMNVDSTVDILEGSESAAMPKFRAAGKRLYSDFIEQISDSNIVTQFNPERLNSLQPHFKKEMNKVIRDHFMELFRETLHQARLELMPMSAKKFSMDDPFMPEQFEEFLRAQSFKIVGDYADSITKRMRNIVLRGMRDGTPLSEMVKLMRGDAQDMTDTWLSTIIRTETTSVYNQGRKSYWESDPIARQIVQGFQYSAIIDSRTTEVCEYLDGKIFDEGDFIDRLTPPLHFNCRSLLVPVTRFEDYRSDKNYIEPGDEPTIDSLKDKGAGLILG